MRAQPWLASVPTTITLEKGQAMMQETFDSLAPYYNRLLQFRWYDARRVPAAEALPAVASALVLKRLR